MRMQILAATLLVAGSAAAPVAQTPPDPSLTVYKAPTCGCCSKWIEHMRQSGFAVQVRERPEADVQKIKDKLGVPKSARSCHTAQTGSYVIEGHVPAADVKRLLDEQPKIVGLVVPGMPAGAPGMDVPGARPRPYDVLAFDAYGKTWVFSTHRP